MSYIEKNLMIGEKVVYSTSLHWIIFLPAIIIGLLGGLFLLLSIAETNKEESVLIPMGVLFIAVTAFFLVRAFLTKWTSEFAVTNKRLILKTGVFSRTTVEQLLTKCEGIVFDQNILGRILGYGTIVTTTGGVTNRFRHVNNPRALRNYINTQIDSVQRAQNDK